MSLLTRKYFRQANITINTLSNIQLSTLQQIEEKYPIIHAAQVQRIIFFIEYGIEDLFSTFEKYFDPARRDNKLRTFDDLVSVFGSETATLIYSDRIKKISLGKRKTENQVEAFVSSSLLFKEADIIYENLTPLQHMRLKNLLNCWSINELQDWKRQVIIFIALARKTRVSLGRGMNALDFNLAVQCNAE
jgi:hypothetical protein